MSKKQPFSLAHVVSGLAAFIYHKGIKVDKNKDTRNVSHLRSKSVEVGVLSSML